MNTKMYFLYFDPQSNSIMNSQSLKNLNLLGVFYVSEAEILHNALLGRNVGTCASKNTISFPV